MWQPRSLRATGGSAGSPSVLPLILVLAHVGCARAPSEFGPQDLRDGHPEPWVTVAHLAPAPPALGSLNHGVIASPAVAQVAAEVAGRLVSRAVSAGDTVAAGQPLARVDDAPYRHARSAARADLRRLEARRDQARRDAARAAALGAQGAVTAARTEAAGAGLAALDAGVQAARARLAEAERQLALATLRAPHAGQVVSTHVEPGELLAVGRPVLTLHAAGAPEVLLHLTHADADHVRLGAAATVHARGRVVPARVVELAPAASPGQLSPARLRLSTDAPLRVGEGVLVRLPPMAPAPSGSAPTQAPLLAPLRAVADPSGERPWILRVRPDRQVERVPVEIHALRGDAVELFAPAGVGEAVVTSHPLRLRPGQRVRVRP